METMLAAIDASGYATSVCDLAAWASPRLGLPVELLHVVQRKDAVAERHDLSGAISPSKKVGLPPGKTERWTARISFSSRSTRLSIPLSCAAAGMAAASAIVAAPRRSEDNTSETRS